MNGDLILEINGLAVSSRPQARDLLAVVRESGSKEAQLKVERDGRIQVATLKLDDSAYPYSEADNHLGIIFMGTGFRTSYLERLRGIIDRHGARRVLFLSSRLVRPLFEQTLWESHLLGGVHLDIEVPQNRYFGGNVFMGDLLVVQDFIDHIKAYLERSRERPDLVVIPASPFNLGQWGRDLTGRVYLDIERETGVPVALVECYTVYD
jgi:hypothetical protein